MKTLKIMVCALFVLCGSFIFAACGKNQDFDTSKISIGKMNEFTYNGEAHATQISYNGVNANVTYALDSDKNNFKPLSQLATVDVGTYNLYYKLSAKGYNDYVSSGTIEVNVVPRELEIYIDDYVWIKSDPLHNLSVGYMSIGIVNNEDVGLEFSFSDNFNKDTAQYGDVYDITCSITNTNYILTSNTAKLYVKDFVNLNDASGNVLGYYSSIQAALDVAQAGQTIVVNSTNPINKTITVDKSITIDGQGTEMIVADSIFESVKYAEKDVTSLFNVVDKNVKLTLKDVILDCAHNARGVSAFAGTVEIDGATITNGKKLDKWRSGGVFITNAASFVMTSGEIVNNDASDEEYTKYCADLWIGANAQGQMNSTIEGGYVGNLFVNSNSYSATDAGKFVMNGGTVENVYVEYDSNYGATFEYKSGEIENLMVSMRNDNGSYYGLYQTFTPVENTTYKGGQLVYAQTETTKSGQTYNDNIDALLEDGKNYIFEGCEFNAPVSTTKKVGIVFNDCVFNANNSTGLYLTSATNIVVNHCEFNGTTTGGYAIDLNIYSTNCENIVIANNIFNTTSADENGAIAIKERLGETDFPTDAWAQGETEGQIGYALIANNAFTNANNEVIVGTSGQGASTSANTSTGDFELFVTDNSNSLTIYNIYKDHSYVEEEYASKVIVQDGGKYSSLLD